MNARAALAAVIGLVGLALPSGYGAPAVPGATEAAAGQPYTLRRRLEVGAAAEYERSLQTETLVTSGDRKERSTAEMKIPRREIFIEVRQDPPSALSVALEAPGQERLTALELNGKNTLNDVPEEQRVRPRPPVLLMAWQGPRGEPIEKREAAANPLAAIEMTFAEMRYLPEQPVKPGDSWSRDLDLGEAKTKITTKFTQTRTVKGKACAVLASTATLVLPEAWAKAMDVRDITFQTLVPLDGGPEVEFSGAATIVQKNDATEMRRVQRFTTTLLKEERLEGDALKHVATVAAQVRKALELARDDKLDEAAAVLEAYLKENPGDEWAAAVQLIGMEIARQKAMTKPMPPERLRLALRNLQNARDNAAGRNDQQQRLQLEQTIGQLATVNLDTLLAESRNPDPIVRDLAAFGLTFARSDAAVKRLLELVADPSGQIRGTSLLGLAVRGVPVEAKVLLAGLKDNDVRVRGAAALLAIQTVKREDAVARDAVPLLRDSMQIEHPWVRANTLLALGALAPPNSAATVRTVLDALKKETQENLKPTYLAVLKQITGIEAKETGPYEEWLKKQPADEKPPPAKPPTDEKPPPKPPDEKPKPKG